MSNTYLITDIYQIILDKNTKSIKQIIFLGNSISRKLDQEYIFDEYNYETIRFCSLDNPIKLVEEKYEKDFICAFKTKLICTTKNNKIFNIKVPDKFNNFQECLDFALNNIEGIYRYRGNNKIEETKEEFLRKTLKW